MVDSASLVQVLRAGDERLETFDFGPHVDVRVWQGVGGRAGMHDLGAGFLEYTGSFDYEVEYHAIYYMLSGSLTVTIGGERHIANAGDILVVSKGARASYQTDGCRAFWVISPSNWEDHFGLISSDEPA